MFTAYVLAAIMLLLERHRVKRNDIMLCVFMPMIPVLNAIISVFFLCEILMYRINIKGKFNK